MTHKALQVAVAIATTGRPAILTETVRALEHQTVPPSLVAICPAENDDVDREALACLALPIQFASGGKGASLQRNALLRMMPPMDIVLFLDDDFLVAADYLEQLARLFADEPSVVLATGTLVADGIHGPGFSPAEARALLCGHRRDSATCIDDVFSGYGCNMGVRGSAITDGGLLFDENLPLYSWAEDVEYSRQAARLGRLVRSNQLVGVHLGTKRGRTSGVRLGYSQIANQVYLRRKGVITTSLALRYSGRNLLANLFGTIRSEAYIDRRGRLLGNIYGLFDLLRGRSSPQRILDL